MPRSRFNQAGYLLADNTASDWGTKDEADMLSCNHCGALIKKSQWVNDGCTCSGCDGFVGIECGCATRMNTRGCEVLTRQIERQLNRQYHAAQNSRILGTRDIV